MEFKTLIEQKLYYAENNINNDFVMQLKTLKEKLGHYKLLSDYELFYSELSSVDNETLMDVYKYFRSSVNNVIKYQILNKIFELNPINYYKDSQELLSKYDLESLYVKNSNLNSIQKIVLLHCLNEPFDEFKSDITFIDVLGYFDNIQLMAKLIPLSINYYVKSIIKLGNEEKSLYLNLLKIQKTKEDLYFEIHELNNGILGTIEKNKDDFIFLYDDNHQESMIKDLGFNVCLDLNDPSLKLELELCSNNDQIAAEVFFINKEFFVNLRKSDQGLFETAKESFIYNMSELITKTSKILNHPYTKIAIATIMVSGAMLHSNEAMAGTNDSNQVHHFSEDQISQIMAHTKYISVMKSKMFGNIGAATDHSLHELHHKEMWHSVDHQLEQLGIDINNLNAKHFNKMTMQNKFDWVKTSEGYEFQGGGLKSRFILHGDHYELIPTDRGLSEIVPQDVFLNWSNKILNNLNEARKSLK